jgi:hypothetical protein
MTFHFNAFQITALETYSNGEFSYLASIPIAEFETSLARCGDTLLHFILHELSPAESCHTRSDAILRLASAAEEIDTIIDTLHNARRETSPQPSDG